MNVLLWILAALAGGYGLVLLALWWGQERLLFMPSPLPADHRFDLGADVQEHWVDVPGARLSALHLRRPGARGLVFYLHGNAGNLQTWFTGADYFRSAGFDLFMIDYRGYGKSSGRIESQAQLEADVRAAWARVAPQYAGRPVVLFGRSLGSGLAAGLAAELQPALTVLVSPYTSLRALARQHYPFVPGALLRYPLATDAALARVRSPVLLLHGADDALIPSTHGEALARVAPQAQLHVVAGAAHNDIHLFDTYLQALRTALDRL